MQLVLAQALNSAALAALSALAILALSVDAISADPGPAATAAETPAAPFDHAAWTELLEEHVTSGLVDYRGLAQDRGRLDSYLARLGSAAPDELSRDEQLAFWINAYNARMVATVLDHFPIEGSDPSQPSNSVLQLPDVFKSAGAAIGGRELSLDQIEHEILRPRFGDARIHAAIVCASLSCPELRAEAFTSERLDEQLEDQARRFVNDPRRNRIDAVEGRAQLSRIFDWFAEDFAAAASGPGSPSPSPSRLAGARAFVARYLAAPESEALLAGRLSIDFLPYDWALNDAATPPSSSR